MNYLNNRVVWVIAGILVLLGILFTYKSKESPSVSTEETVTTTKESTSTATKPGTTTGTVKVPGVPADYATYNNANYKFAISYPRYVTPLSIFQAFQILGTDWRVNATGFKRGIPVASFQVYRNDQTYKQVKNFPLYYGTEVRVGVSVDTANCYSTDDGYTNQKVTNVTINGVTFKDFTFGTAATGAYLNGESFRTIHNNYCYVVEQIRVGSSYRDPSMTTSTPQSTLDSYYSTAGNIVKTFRFTK